MRFSGGSGLKNLDSEDSGRALHCDAVIFDTLTPLSATAAKIIGPEAVARRLETTYMRTHSSHVCLYV